jgi:uncharacterized small protein (DUF1192 family)
MTSADAIRDFLVLGADHNVLDAYLSELARNDASERLGLLQQETARLEQEVGHLHKLKADRLLVFVPIFFRSFWTRVTPDEFAAICGRLDAPRIASPYIEPSRDTVLLMKERFKALDAADRDQVLALCGALRHRLQVRAEMREFF